MKNYIERFLGTIFKALEFNSTFADVKTPIVVVAIRTRPSQKTSSIRSCHFTKEFAVFVNTTSASFKIFATLPD